MTVQEFNQNYLDQNWKTDLALKVKLQDFKKSVFAEIGDKPNVYKLSSWLIGKQMDQYNSAHFIINMCKQDI